MIRTLALLTLSLLMLAAGFVAAEDPPAPPEPSRLSADWWSYFAPDPALNSEGLEKRAAMFKAALSATLSSLDPARKLELEPRVTRIKESLDRYLSRFAETPAVLPSATLTAESYSLNKAPERHREWRKLRLETISLREEADWQEKVIGAERRQHSRRKVNYLELDPASPQRIDMGLDLVASRLQLELQMLDLKRRTRKLSRLDDTFTALDQELSQIAPRLIITAEEPALWEERRLTALETAAKLREEAHAADNTDNRVDQTKSDFVTARMVALKSVERNVQAAEQDLLAYRALLSREILSIVAVQDPPVVDAKEALRETVRILEVLEPQKGYWKRAAERVRTSAAGQDATDLKSKDKKLMQASVETITQTLLRVEQEEDTINFLDNLLDERIRMLEGTLKRGFEHIKDTLIFSWREAEELVIASLFEVNETPVTLLGLIRVVVIITGAFLLSKAVRRTMERIAARRTGVSHSSFYTLGRVVHYFVLGSGFEALPASQQKAQ